MRNCCFAFVMILSFSTPAQEYFQGTIVYSTHASGEKEASELFTNSQADEISVSWSKVGFEQRENKGWNQGKIIYNVDENSAFFCDSKKGTFEKATVQDFAKTDPKVKEFMPKLFSYEIKSLGDRAEIAGYSCERFEVVQSGFMRAGATVYVWIAKDLKLRPSQIKFDTEWKQILAVMPLQYGFTEGAVLRATTYEQSFNGKGIVEVTYEVSEIKESYFPKGFMEVPEGFGSTKKP